MQEDVLTDNLKPGIKGFDYFHQQPPTTDLVTMARYPLLLRDLVVRVVVSAKHII
jgi:hypothetical protein